MHGAVNIKFLLKSLIKRRRVGESGACMWHWISFLVENSCPSDVIPGSAESFAYGSLVIWPACAGKRVEFLRVWGVASVDVILESEGTTGMLFPWQFMAPHMHGNGYPPPVYGKGSITVRITLRPMLVSSFKFQIIIFVYYSNFVLHFILCFSKGIVPFWTAVLNRQCYV
jgi:hypothetical protein